MPSALNRLLAVRAAVTAGRRLAKSSAVQAHLSDARGTDLDPAQAFVDRLRGAADAMPQPG